MASPPKPDLCLYHWAPSARRRSIQRLGLVPGRLNVTGELRPPYVCFADNPVLAWSLSGRMHPEIPEWDLWMVFAGHVEVRRRIDTFSDTGRRYVLEYRVHDRIPKRHVRYVGTRAV